MSTWDDLMASTDRLGPTEYALGPVPLEAKAPVPGTDPRPALTTI